jgi:hemerythrin-like domain-containing protein
MNVEPARHAARLLATMHEDHVTLEHALSELLERAYEDDREELRQAFRALESELRAHLELEERDLLPRFELVSPAEAEHVRADHELIRSRLDALGLALDLRSLRAHDVSEFVALLRAHATREEKIMYRWADAALTESEKWPLVKWVGARIEERLGQRILG